MAEQEACAELVEKASSEATMKESGSTVHGESLLLPLLQGLLDTPENDQHNDSGTESGEDLRSGLILEVQGALDKLSASLKSASTSISEDKRDSLLLLVNRLQAGLSCQLTPSSSTERRSSLQNKFTKRKQRPNRHTVGVSSEELEDARRLMEEISLNEDICGSPKGNRETPLQKQNSEGSVLQSSAFRPLSKTSPVKNVTAKPFISSNATSQSQSGTSSTVETPSETSGSLEFLLSDKSQSDISRKNENVAPAPTFHHSVSLESYHQPQSDKNRFLSESMSLDSSRDVDFISVQKAVTQAAAIKQLSQLKSDVSEDAEVQDSETDDDPITLVKVSAKCEVEEPQPQQPQPDLILQTNPLYNKSCEEEKNSDEDDYPTQLNERANKFNSKKLKMKRANTIDIPKPLKYYECDDDDSDNEEVNSRRSNYLALRGPIRVGKPNVEKKVPEFQPKTESDKKFLAFLGKCSDNESNKPSPWQKQPQPDKNVSNWNNKFGNIKNNFEKVNVSNSVNSARNFWKSADDSVAAGKLSHIGPKISKQSARNLQQMFEEKQKQFQKQPATNVDNKNVVTGSLRLDTKSNKNVAVVTQPNAINKFSHAPMSAFKPVNKKIEDASLLKPKPVTISGVRTQPSTQKIDSNGKTPESPLYLYSPKQFSPQNTSPVHFTPWNSNKSGESRVLSIVASKFENNTRDKVDFVAARKMSKEKIAIPQSLFQHNHQQQEKLSAPYLVKNAAKNNTVRKLSGQYDSMGNKDTDYVVHSNRPPRVFVPGENYTIQYNNPVALPKLQPKVYNAEYTITQQHYNVPKTQDDDYIQENKRYNQPPLQVHEQTKVMQPAQVYNDEGTIPTEYQQVQLRNKQQTHENILRSSGHQTYNQLPHEIYDQTKVIQPTEVYNDEMHIYNEHQQVQLRNKQQTPENKCQPSGQQTYNQIPLETYDQSKVMQPTQVYNDEAQIHNEHQQVHLRSKQQTPENKFQPSAQQTYNQVPLEMYDQTKLIQPTQVYNDEAHIHNEHQQVHLRNKQQTPENKFQPCSQQIPTQSQSQFVPHPQHAYTQPELYNEDETVKQDDNYQYTSNFQFQPQMQQPKHSIYAKNVVTQVNRNSGYQNEDDRHYDNNRDHGQMQNLNLQDQEVNHHNQSDRRRSTESVQEYTAVSSKVMSGPVSQQAVTVQQNSPKSRDQHDMEFNLKASLQKFSAQLDNKEQKFASPLQKTRSSVQQHQHSTSSKENVTKEIKPALIVYNNVNQRPSLRVNDKPLSLESLEINERGESVLTSKFHIPVKQTRLTSPNSGHELSKSESWHQICQSGQSLNKPSPRASPNSRLISRSKSSHTLAVPKQYEAGMSKTEMLEKRKTMEAYFGGSNQQQKEASSKKQSSINRVKTSQKISTQRQNSTGLCRSKTLPDIVCLDKVDDGNIDAIFEDLFNARTTRTYTEGPVTTTSQVTTRVTSQQQVKKPMSPFAKFRQLDKQNSLNSPPSTPKSPNGGGPLFKFTDPSLNQSANTVKQRLLQWCQMKTKEYENIQLDNFSTSWADGMAFCALIHHFLPEAFDYKILNPRNRRHNFTLAFRVADEKAGVAPLLDVDDMVAISKPDWKCVFTYVQSIYRRFKDED